MRWIALVLVAAACSSGTTSGHATATGPRAHSVAAQPAAPTAPLVRAECEQLLDHFLALSLAEKRQSLPPEQVPTEQQVSRIRISLHDSAMTSCLASPRPTYECAMAAATTASLRTCLGARPAAHD